MNYISVKHLKAVGAYKGEVTKFKEIFGDSISFGSLEEAKALAKKYAQEFDFDFMGEAVFDEAYEEAREHLWQAYWEARVPHLQAYLEAVAPLRQAYKEAIVPHKQAYWEAKAPHHQAYLEAVAPHRQAYLEAVAQVFAEMWWNKES